MRLDRNKPFGEVFGHAYAVYEQGGVLFDGAGAPLILPEPKKTEEFIPQFSTDSPVNYEIQQARDFLNGILKEGPLTQNAIYREAENNNQNWEAVKTAFAAMHGQTFKQRNGFYWKLKTK